MPCVTFGSLFSPRCSRSCRLNDFRSTAVSKKSHQELRFAGHPEVSISFTCYVRDWSIQRLYRGERKLQFSFESRPRRGSGIRLQNVCRVIFGVVIRNAMVAGVRGARLYWCPVVIVTGFMARDGRDRYRVFPNPNCFLSFTAGNPVPSTVSTR